MNYRVTWTIDIEADSPRDAAQEALDIQRSISDATVFEVRDKFGITEVVDLNIAE